MHTAKKKYREWEELFREEIGCIVTGDRYHVDIHHPIYRTGKHNKILIGPIFILPLHPELHRRESKRPDAWHKNKHLFQENHGKESDLFEQCLARIEHLDWPFKITDEEKKAIREVRV